MTELQHNLLIYLRGEKGSLTAKTIALDWQILPAYPTLTEAEVETALEQLAIAGWVRRDGELWSYVPEVPVMKPAEPVQQELWA